MCESACWSARGLPLQQEPICRRADWCSSQATTSFNHAVLCGHLTKNIKAGVPPQVIDRAQFVPSALSYARCVCLFVLFCSDIA